ncbi:MAG: cation-translocating P-type ATPase [Dehalococcoidales bacterium]|nr:cation-translocating P-type ATPase [Dehalococcoidales bacterium]
MAQNFSLNKVGDIRGLSEAAAADKLAREGYNEIPSARKRGFMSIVWSVVREPMLLLLLGGGLVYMALGDVEEALILLFFVFVIIGITIYQERKTERTLEALRDLSSPRAMVIRDGASKRIAGREVVREDVMVLAEGDRVPADGVVLAANNLTVDESLLTGESVPVHKIPTDAPKPMQRPGADNAPFVYSGTLVVGGLGIASVAATGMNTEFGRIGKSLQSIETERTPLQKETSRIVRSLAIIGLSLSALLAIVYGLTRGNWLQGFLASITLGMAILPEEFPVVLTIFLALGAWRISQSQVLTRRMPAIETLGSTTVLCVDKTGTLTLNRMSVAKLFANGEFFTIEHGKPKPPPEKFHHLIEYSILASQINPFDPMEKALKEVGDEYHNLTPHIHRDWTVVQEYPLSRRLLALSRVWKSPQGEDYVIAAKGAPEAVIDLCHLDEAQTGEISRQISVMAGDGLRVLGVARAHFKPAELPSDQHVFKFDFLGLVGFTDPIRPTVPDAIKECYSAGIRVAMITGDYPLTAQYVARQIGLKPADKVITGPEMNEMSDAELAERIKSVSIFARTIPEQKLRLVNAFKLSGEIVAMTGDGVNDAPALKAANIGVAMGERGTDVAREAGALVLLDDDFSSIVKAVRMGRRIFDNLRKAMAYILAVHVPIAGLSLIPVLLKMPLVLLPVHVVFLELIIDPASSIVFEAEPEEKGIMLRPPRNPKEPLLSRRTIVFSLLQGLAVLVVSLALYVYSLTKGGGELDARTMTFTTLVIANLGLILTNRYWSGTIFASLGSKNVALRWILIATLVFLALVIYVPALRGIFQFGPLHPLDLAVCIVAGGASIVWFEMVKYVGQRRNGTAKPVKSA